MIRITLISLLSILTNSGFSQSVNETKKEHKYEHYIGGQVNQLIMRMFNSNATTIGSGNPYLFTYSINNTKTGWGLRFGAGYNTTANSTASGTTSSTTDNDDFQFRAGIEKIIHLSEKWTAGTGVDLVMNSIDDKSVSTSFQYNYNTTTTTNKVFTLGGGVFGKVNYHLSKKILLGTEASLYYYAGTKDQSSASDIVYVNNPPQHTVSKSRPSIHQGNFNLHIVLYLILKL